MPLTWGTMILWFYTPGWCTDCRKDCKNECKSMRHCNSNANMFVHTVVPCVKIRRGYISFGMNCRVSGLILSPGLMLSVVEQDNVHQVAYCVHGCV